MTNGQKPSWLNWLVHGWKITVFVTFLTVGVGWGGWGLFRFFSPPSTPTTKPPTTCATIDNPEDEDKPESDQDYTSTSVIAGSKTTNLIEENPKTELKTLTSGESSVSLLYPPSSGAGSEPTVESQDTTSLVAISEFTPSSVSGSGSGSETGGQSSESTEQSQEMPGIDENDTKPESRRILRLELSEEEKHKNAVLLQSIRCKKSRIRETKFLIRKSNSITYKRQAEWNLIFTELSGIRDEVIRAHLKELERAKVRVLALEQVSRTKYGVQIGLLEYQIQKDKKNILKLVAIPEEPEETSNC